MVVPVQKEVHLKQRVSKNQSELSLTDYLYFEFKKGVGIYTYITSKETEQKYLPTLTTVSIITAGVQI